MFSFYYTKGVGWKTSQKKRRREAVTATLQQKNVRLENLTNTQKYILLKKYHEFVNKINKSNFFFPNLFYCLQSRFSLRRYTYANVLYNQTSTVMGGFQYSLTFFLRISLSHQSSRNELHEEAIRIS